MNNLSEKQTVRELDTDAKIREYNAALRSVMPAVQAQESKASFFAPGVPLFEAQGTVVSWQDSSKFQRAKLPGSEFNRSETLEVHSQTQITKKPTVEIKAFLKVSERWNLTRAQEAALLGLIGNTELSNRILRAYGATLHDDMKERLVYLIGISYGLSELFRGNLTSEQEWLNTPRADLDSLSPLDFMTKGKMKNVIIVSDLVTYERGFLC